MFTPRRSDKNHERVEIKHKISYPRRRFRAAIGRAAAVKNRMRNKGRQLNSYLRFIDASRSIGTRGVTMSNELRISFPEASSAERSRLAQRLQTALVEVRGLQVSLVKERPDSQDAGTVLSVVLSAPAIVLSIKAISAWLVRNNQTSITILKPDGAVIIKNMRSEDAPKAIEALKEIVGT
jgi:hypothetical protein